MSKENILVNINIRIHQHSSRPCCRAVGRM
jgi:hypothetical protein